MPSRSKTKGNKFENDMVKLLNEVYNTKEFSRTPNSGAIMGRTNWGKNQGLSENVKRTLGSDLIVPDDFKFAVECKHYADTPNYAQIIKGPDTTLDHWLAEATFDAINLDLHPLLFFKTNRKGVHFALPEYFHMQYMEYEGATTTNVMGDYFLHYGPFVISGIDTFLENAEGIKFVGEEYLFNKFKRTFFKDTRVLELLKVLD